MTSFLNVTREGPIVLLAMNAPEVRNALTGNTAVAEFLVQAESINADLSVKAVIVTGYPGMFCSGGNLKDMKRYFNPELTQGQIAIEYRTGIQKLAQAMYGLDVPTIAAVGGPAIGAGCDLACMCDMRVASENAYFAESFIKVGLVPGDGGASGGNLKDMKRYFNPELTQGQIAIEYRTGIQKLAQAMYGLDVPTIAAVGGPAIGAGCDLACMCDMRVASENAYFAESFIKVGLVPGDGGAWLLTRTVGRARAAEMAFTGEPLSAVDALQAGLVSRVVPEDQLMTTALELAAKVAKLPGSTLRMTKRLLRESQTADLDTVLEMSAVMQSVAHGSWEHREAVTAFLEKRAPNFDTPPDGEQA